MVPGRSKPGPRCRSETSTETATAIRASTLTCRAVTPARILVNRTEVVSVFAGRGGGRRGRLHRRREQIAARGVDRLLGRLDGRRRRGRRRRRRRGRRRGGGLGGLLPFLAAGCG